MPRATGYSQCLSLSRLHSYWTRRSDPQGGKEERQFPKRLDLLRLALPYDENVPPFTFELQDTPSVALNIQAELLRPERGIRLWGVREAATIVSMPIAPVDEDDGPAALEDDVRATGKTTAMKSKTKAASVQETPHQELRTRVASADPAHVPASPVRSHPVHASILAL